MKLCFAVFIFAVCSCTQTEAAPENRNSMKQKSGAELLKLLIYFLECILENIKKFSEDDMPEIIEALQKALWKLSVCSDLYLTGTSDKRFSDWLNCVIDKIQLISATDVPKIIKELKPIIQKFQNIEYCFLKAVDKYCDDLCDDTVVGFPLVCKPSSTDFVTLIGYLIFGLSNSLCTM
ncbi:hypothetical protein FQR65_LT19558 [Abscondita terminalis]|nr:hypothetical protein FQR65_LT19558 [Abscondita terminalis]